jgi:3-isopropylmalate/(R)-2-methylmalate dehydratase small subunit
MSVARKDERPESARDGGHPQKSEAREPFTSLTSTFVVVPADNIDTDQIIPARFLKVTDKRGLGDRAFADWRYGPDGKPNADFPLNRPDAAGAKILVAGANFGCGSSREHAPWALVGWGLRAIVAPSFADIFKENAMKNGLLPVAVGAPLAERLMARRAADARTTLSIDLPAQTVGLVGEAPATFDIDPFSKNCLLHGLDELGYLLDRKTDIERYENQHPY